MDPLGMEETRVRTMALLCKVTPAGRNGAPTRYFDVSSLMLSKSGIVMELRGRENPPDILMFHNLGKGDFQARRANLKRKVLVVTKLFNPY